MSSQHPHPPSDRLPVAVDNSQAEREETGFEYSLMSKTLPLTFEALAPVLQCLHPHTRSLVMPGVQVLLFLLSSK